MSIFVHVSIECDRCGVVQELGDADDYNEGAESARERGWRTGPNDLCPACVGGPER